MTIQKLDAKIKTLKSKIKAGHQENTDPRSARKIKKSLKRAQRRKNCLVKRAALIASKQKKEKAAS
ncbi:MAG: hypothetical protein ACE5F7_07300 [Nitrospiria bacterium]